MRALTVAALGLVLLAGCGQSIDDDQWRDDLSSAGVEVSDWDAYRETWVDICEDSDQGFGLAIAASIDAGGSMDAVRANVNNACPDRLDEVEDLESDLGSADRACETPETSRTEEQSRLAEAIGC